MTKRKSPLALLPPGRKRIIDEDVTRKLEEAFAMDCTIGEACAYAGISDDTYHRERHRDPDFAAKMDRAQQFVFVLAKKTLREALADKDGNLALKFLKNRQADRYHEKVEQAVRQTTVEEVLDEVEAQTKYPEKFGLPGAEKKAGG